MAQWQLGHADEARQWYEKAVRWMEERCPKVDPSKAALCVVRTRPETTENLERLLRRRGEAAALLGIPDKPPAGNEIPDKPK